MAVVGKQVSVNDVGHSGPTLLMTGAGSMADQKPVTLKNQDATNSVFLGGSTVTASGGSAGYELKAGVSITVALLLGDDLYAMASTNGTRVDVLSGRN